MRSRILATALAILVTTTVALGQSQQPQQQPPQPQSGAQAATPVTKVGIINVRQAIVSSAEGKQASAELQSQFAARQSELESLGKQVEDLQNRLRTGDRLSDEERNRLGRQYQQLSRLFQRKQEDLREDLQAAEDEVVQRIGVKMMEVVDRYARENGFAVVLDVSGPQGPVVYASNQVDMTQNIIRLYDQAHPVSGAAAQPAPPRPQPGQTRPQPQQPPPQKPPER